MHSFLHPYKKAIQKKDIGTLVRDILKILTPHGKIILTTNSRAHSPEDLAALVRDESEALGLPQPSSIVTLIPPALDFPSQGRDSIAMRGVVVEV